MSASSGEGPEMGGAPGLRSLHIEPGSLSQPCTSVLVLISDDSRPRGSLAIGSAVGRCLRVIGQGNIWKRAYAEQNVEYAEQ